MHLVFVRRPSGPQAGRSSGAYSQNAACTSWGPAFDSTKIIKWIRNVKCKTAAFEAKISVLSHYNIFSNYW
jgi:hypothetical protein